MMMSTVHRYHHPPPLPRPSLSRREVEVLRTWFACDSKSQAGARLNVSVGTINTHLGRIRAKYSAVGRAAPTKASLVARALQDGIVDIEEL
ncbi:DNA-binding CsgD family transcriptional regulator [Hoyosella altamirensis]|uniref:DNA-binding CsgD family transcriptional regulator n=2 Tax=Hoyosella altamirensis TaxID=616997 RepID=A0A839RIU0_9ACTN|nr:DNA-binding CsgD family transcriptional regulator [Hoyosella altamirensis]